jgi:hypothetical protein
MIDRMTAASYDPALSAMPADRQTDGQSEKSQNLKMQRSEKSSGN